MNHGVKDTKFYLVAVNIHTKHVTEAFLYDGKEEEFHF